MYTDYKVKAEIFFLLREKFQLHVNLQHSHLTSPTQLAPPALKINNLSEQVAPVQPIAVRMN